jgi:restriction endonuclease S subunit
MVVNTGIVKNWPIPVISLEEQKKVSDQIAEMRESVADLQGKLRLESELFDELRSALLHEAFPLESNVT